MLHVLVKMVKVRKDYIFAAFGYMEKSYYEGVNRKKLFELMRGYGMHRSIVGRI